MSLTVPFSDDTPKNPANAQSIWDSAEPENPKLYPHPVEEYRVMRVPYTKENLPPEDSRSILERTRDPQVSEMQEFHRRMQREEDGAVAREAYVKLSNEASAFLFGNQESGGGLLASKGKDALESVSRMRDWFGKTTEKIGRDMTSGAADQFEKMALDLRVPLVARIARNQVHEKFAWEVDSLNKQIDAEHGNAAACFADPKSFEAALARQTQAIRDLGAKTCLSEEEQENRIYAAASSAAMSRVDRFIESGDLDGADDALQDRRINLADYYAVEARLEKAWGAKQLEEGYALMQTDPDRVISLMEDHYKAIELEKLGDSVPQPPCQGTQSPGPHNNMGSKGLSPLAEGSGEAEPPRVPRRVRGLDDKQASDLMDAAKRAAVQVHASAAAETLRDVPLHEAYAMLDNPESRAALELKGGLTDEEVMAAKRMLYTDAFHAHEKQRRERLDMETKGLGELVRMGMNKDIKAEDLQRMYKGLMRLPDDFDWKHDALVALQNGTMGKQDDPAYVAGLFAKLAGADAGAGSSVIQEGAAGQGGSATQGGSTQPGTPLDPEIFAAELLRGIARGKLTPSSKAAVEGLQKTLLEPEGAFYGKGIRDMMQRFAPDPNAIQPLPNPQAGGATSGGAWQTMECKPEIFIRQTQAMSLLLSLLDQAKAKGSLADAIDPANPDNLIDKVHRIVGGKDMANAVDETAAQLTADQPPLDDSQKYQVAEHGKANKPDAASPKTKPVRDASQSGKKTASDKPSRPPQRANDPVWEAQVKDPAEKQGKPGENPPSRRYYVVGRRELDVPGFRGRYNKEKSTSMEHRHFIADDGHNQGLTIGGVFKDSPENMKKYQYLDDKKYDAECMDEAFKRVDEKFKEQAEKMKRGYSDTMQKIKENAPLDSEPSLSQESIDAIADDPYVVRSMDCQIYVNEVLKEAANVAKEKGKPLFAK